jgi:ribosomal protein S27AE
MARSSIAKAGSVVSGKPFEKINIFVQQPNDMSNGRSINGRRFLVCGLMCLVGGLWLSDSVSAVIHNCDLTLDVVGFKTPTMPGECDQARADNALGFLGILVGCVLVIVGLILVGFFQPAKPASEGQTVLIIDEGGSSVVSTQSETAFCPKCGDPYSLRTPDSNFCPKCGNPLTH